MARIYCSFPYSALNFIDASHLENLKAINQRMKDAGIEFHLSDVKGPVRDGLKKAKIFKDRESRIYCTHFDAISIIDPVLVEETLEKNNCNQKRLKK